MPSPASSTAPSAPPDTSAWIRAVAETLTGIGMTVAVSETSTGLDVTASTPRHPGRHRAEIILDEQGYAELRFWADTAAPAGTVAAAMAAVMAAAQFPGSDGGQV
jgi:hypothetical protein